MFNPTLKTPTTTLQAISDDAELTENGFDDGKEEAMNVLLADEPISQSKSPTTRLCVPETGFIRPQKYHCPVWADTGGKKYLVGWCKVEAISAAN